MDSQLDAVRHRICKAEDEIAEVKQKLAAAERAHDAEREQSLFNLLLSLNNQLSGLQEEKNILLRNQAPSKPCLRLVHTGSPVFTSCCTAFSE